MKKLLFFIITMQITLFAQDPTPINSGDVVEDHVDYLEKKHYIFDLDKGKTAIVKLTDLDADIDLYVALNHVADIRDNDCYSSNGGTTNEKCLLDASETQKSNEIRIMVYGFKASNYKLEVSTKDGLEEITEISDTPIAGQVEKGDAKLYKFAGKKGESYTTTLSALSADADLRVRIGKKANLHSFDCKSTNGRTKTDECSVTLTKDATVYVHVNGYKAASYKIGVVKFDPTQNFPKTRLFTEDKKYFLAYQKVDRSTEVFVVNNETKKETYHHIFPGGILGAFDFIKIENANIFITSTNRTSYAINENGELAEISKEFYHNPNSTLHINNYAKEVGKELILKVQNIGESRGSEFSYDVTSPFNTEIVDKKIYEGKELVSFLAQYNCSNLHTNNKIKVNTSSSKLYICSEENNKAYILYNNELTLIDVNNLNAPLLTLENPPFDGDKNSLNKIDGHTFYTVSSKEISNHKYKSIYSIYRKNTLSLILQQPVIYKDRMVITSIEYKAGNKIVVHLTEYLLAVNQDDKNGVKIYDISDIKNPKLIKDDDFPDYKITILDK